MDTYDPYTYNPMLRAFYVDSNFTNRATLPPAPIVQAAEDDPQAAAHLYSVWAFLDWMRDASPQLYSAIANTPLADPVTVVKTEAIVPRSDSKRPAPSDTARLQGMAGLGEVTFGDEVTIGADNPVAKDVVSEWGQRIADLAGKYLQYDTQKQLMNLNIKRAEKGLPPVDPGTLAPQVNVGLSPQAQQIAYLAVGGLVLAGIVAAMRKK